MSKTQASIRTRFIGPTNTKGQPITVTKGQRITVTDNHLSDRRRRSEFNWKEGKGLGENHRLAAQAWLDVHNPGATVTTPGLAFGLGDFYWAWEF
jgi:hypothetical protein